jgi:uncharacterized protein
MPNSCVTTQTLPTAPVTVPTRLQCLRLQQRMHMPMHIQNHCRQVCRVAMALANAGNGHWPRLDQSLIQAAALLHDITKSRSFITGENHAATGEKLLKNMGYVRIGAIVGQHVKLRYAAGAPAIGEAHIINYADKRVLHDRIVSLDERMHYILARYGHAPWQRQRLHAIWEETRSIESRIWADTGYHPDDLLRLTEPR